MVDRASSNVGPRPTMQILPKDDKPQGILSTIVALLSSLRERVSNLFSNISDIISGVEKNKKEPIIYADLEEFPKTTEYKIPAKIAPEEEPVYAEIDFKLTKAHNKARNRR